MGRVTCFIFLLIDGHDCSNSFVQDTIGLRSFAAGGKLLQVVFRFLTVDVAVAFRHACMPTCLYVCLFL